MISNFGGNEELPKHDGRGRTQGRNAFSWRMNSGMRKVTPRKLTIASQDARKWSIADGLVRERDGDQEHDHNESDRISIELFPIDVDTHRTALLFAEATMKQ